MKKDIKHVLFRDCVIRDDILYFFSYNMNLLCSTNLNNEETKILMTLPSEDFFQEDLIGSILLYEDKLILIPVRAKQNAIFIFDLNNNTLDTISLGETKVEPPFEKYASACIYNNEVVLIGCYIPEIVVVNLETGVVDHIKVCEGVNVHFLNFNLRKGDYLYVPSAERNQVLLYDLRNKKFTWKEAGNKGNSYCDIKWDGEKFWLIPWKYNCLVKWDGDKKYDLYDLPEELHFISEMSFYGGLIHNNKMLISGNHGCKSVKFDVDKCGKGYLVEKDIYILLKSFDSGEYITETWDGDIFFYGEKAKKINVSIRRTELIEKLSELENAVLINGFWSENKDIDLEFFLDVMKR